MFVVYVEQQSYEQHLILRCFLTFCVSIFVSFVVVVNKQLDAHLYSPSTLTTNSFRSNRRSVSQLQSTSFRCWNASQTHRYNWMCSKWPTMLMNPKRHTWAENLQLFICDDRNIYIMNRWEWIYDFFFSSIFDMSWESIWMELSYRVVVRHSRETILRSCRIWKFRFFLAFFFFSTNCVQVNLNLVELIKIAREYKRRDYLEFNSFE